jgi:hypothetical protein
METVALPPSRGLPLKDLLTDRDGCASALRGGIKIPRVMNKMKAITAKTTTALSLPAREGRKAPRIITPFRPPRGERPSVSDIIASQSR